MNSISGNRNDNQSAASSLPPGGTASNTGAGCFWMQTTNFVSDYERLTSEQVALENDAVAIACYRTISNAVGACASVEKRLSKEMNKFTREQVVLMALVLALAHGAPEKKQTTDSILQRLDAR